VTSMSGHFAAIIAMVGPPTYPAPRQVIFMRSKGCDEYQWDDRLASVLTAQDEGSAGVTVSP